MSAYDMFRRMGMGLSRGGPGNGRGPGTGAGGRGRGRGRGGRGGGGSSGPSTTITKTGGLGIGGWSGSTNYGNQNYGDADATRIVAVGISWGRTGAVRDITSVSIGGVAATKVADINANSTDAAEIWAAELPTNDNTNLTVVWDGTGGSISAKTINIYRITGCSLSDRTSGTNSGFSTGAKTVSAGAHDAGAALISVGTGNENDSVSLACSGTFGTTQAIQDSGQEHLHGHSWGIAAAAGPTLETYTLTGTFTVYMAAVAFNPL